MRKRIISAFGLFCILGILCIANKEKVTTTIMPNIQNLTDMQYSISKTTKKQGNISYRNFISSIDEKILAIKEAELQSEQYWEKITDIFLYRKDIYGVLNAYYQNEQIFSFQISMEEGNDRQKYTFNSLGNDMYWFSCQLERADDINLPDYVVNENVLRYFTLNEEVRDEDRKWLEACYLQELSVETQEYLIKGTKIYQINRADELLTDVSDESIKYIAKWLLQQPTRIGYQLMRDNETLEYLKSIIPKEYELYYSDYVVNDLNQDGYDDYVAVLYPKDTKEDTLDIDETDPFYYDPYYRSASYCTSGFWLLLSNEDGSYEALQQSDSIEYIEETALTLESMHFIENDILELEYFVGRAPWSNAVVQFKYNVKRQLFYLYKTFYRETDVHLIADEDNYGDNTTMHYYYSHNTHYKNSIWQTNDDDITISETQNIYNYTAKLVYLCDDTVKERYINGSIWELEKDILNRYIQKYPAFKISFETERYVYNDRIISGYIAILERYNKDFSRRMFFPVVLNKDTREAINIKQLVTKQEFMQAVKYQEGMDGEEFMDEAELERCLTLLDTGWENVNNTEAIMVPDNTDIAIIVEDAGVAIQMYCTDEEMFQDVYFIEKEYFMNTGLWEYFSVD